MPAEIEITLTVNDSPIELNEFAEQYLVNVVIGAVSTLRGFEVVYSMDISLKGEEVRVILNGNELSLTPFPNDIIAGTLTGMVSSLRGVDRIVSLRIELQKL